MPDSEPKEEWLDGSGVSLLHLCPQKYFRSREQHLALKATGLQDYANPAQYGTALHAALASLYSGDGMVQDTCPCPSTTGCEFCGGNRIPRMVARFLINYPVDPKDDSDSRRRDPRTKANGIEILKGYVRRYLGEKREGFTIVGTELAFELPFKDDDGNVKFIYVGRIDLLISQHDNLKPWDHKSSTQVGSNFWEAGWRLNHSMTGYMVSTHEFTQLPCMSATINGIKIANKVDDNTFQRVETSRSPAEFEEWQKEVWNAYELILKYRKQGFWPKHSPFACSAYFRTCEYYSLCCVAGDKEMEQNIIEKNFEVKEWHPFHDVD